MVRNITILSQELDIHALAILHGLRSVEGVRAHLVATDNFMPDGGLRWRSHLPRLAELKTIDGHWLNIAEQNVIWWRRVNQPQKGTENLEEGELKEFINNEWRSAFVGLVHEAFTGVWVNNPARDSIAGNKLFQLNAAVSCGFDVPRTIVTQDLSLIRSFADDVGGRVVVKKLMGTRHAPLATVEIDVNALRQEDVLVCPAIYQEYIDADYHLRVNAFGDDISALLIRSESMDWRRDMQGEFAEYPLSQAVSQRLRLLLDRLGLEMGVFDLIQPRSGELKWIELNTQGQFLFGEGKTGADIKGRFCNYMIERCKNTVQPKR